MRKLDLIVEQLSAAPKRIFLIDGSGALLTAILLLTVLARFEDYFGMPQMIIYLLALISTLYMIYSIICHFVIKHNYRSYLKFIVLANSIYCCFIFTLVYYFYTNLTVLGICYFLLETLVIGFLVLVEYKLLKQLEIH